MNMINEIDEKKCIRTKMPHITVLQAQYIRTKSASLSVQNVTHELLFSYKHALYYTVY